MNDIEQKKAHKFRGLDGVIIFLVTLTGTMFFFCVWRALNGESFFNPWISTAIYAIFFETMLILFAVTAGIKKLFLPVVSIAFLPSIIFTPILWHIFIVIVACLITFAGLRAMRKTLFNMLKINMSTIIHSGMVYVNLAIVLVVTSQYYFFIKQDNKMIFDADNYVSVTNVAVDRLLKIGNNDNTDVNTMTVDDFLNFMINNVYSETNDDENVVSDNMLVRWMDKTKVGALQKAKDLAQEGIKEQMRANLSKTLGREVTDSELISRVFAEIISTRVNYTMENNAFLRKNKEIIFTFVFFTIAYSLASLVRICTTAMSRFVFMLMREFKIVRVAKTKRDAEVIVL